MILISSFSTDIGSLLNHVDILFLFYISLCSDGCHKLKFGLYVKWVNEIGGTYIFIIILLLENELVNALLPLGLDALDIPNPYLLCGKLVWIASCSLALHFAT